MHERGLADAAGPVNVEHLRSLSAALQGPAEGGELERAPDELPVAAPPEDISQADFFGFPSAWGHHVRREADSSITYDES